MNKLNYRICAHFSCSDSTLRILIHSWVECKASASVWISHYITLSTANKSSTSKLIQYLLLYMDINQRINWDQFTMAFHINSAQLKSSLPNGPALIHLLSNYSLYHLDLWSLINSILFVLYSMNYLWRVETFPNTNSAEVFQRLWSTRHCSDHAFKQGMSLRITILEFTFVVQTTVVLTENVKSSQLPE